MAMQPRTIASALLLFTGVAHVSGGADGAGMVAWPRWLALVLLAVGGLGGSGLLREHFDPVLALFVAIDVVVVGCCIALLVARRRAA
jgi:hypothetical protein